MARPRGREDRPADVIGALPNNLRTFNRTEWKRPDDAYDGNARRRWQSAREKYVARWGVGPVELLLMERRAQQQATVTAEQRRDQARP